MKTDHNLISVFLAELDMIGIHFDDVSFNAGKFDDPSLDLLWQVWSFKSSQLKIMKAKEKPIFFSFDGENYQEHDELAKARLEVDLAIDGYNERLCNQQLDIVSDGNFNDIAYGVVLGKSGYAKIDTVTEENKDQYSYDIGTDIYHLYSESLKSHSLVLDAPCQAGGGIFHKGVSVTALVNSAKSYYNYNQEHKQAPLISPNKMLKIATGEIILVEKNKDTVIAIEKMVEEQVEASGITQDLHRLDGWRILDEIEEAQKEQ